MDKPSMIIICGPTGVGKSDCAEMLAQQISGDSPKKPQAKTGEIVNMDLGQFYTPLSIGTAKPDWRNATIPHHLFDILDTPTNFTVVQYRERLLATCNELWKRNVTPIVVGGSFFYLKSLFFQLLSDPSIHLVTSDFAKPFDPSLNSGLRTKGKSGVYPERSEGVDRQDEQGVGGWEDLNAIDAVRAAALHKNDTYRIDRALEIWRTTGVKPSVYQSHFQMPCNVRLIFLTRNRDELYARINERVIMMLQAGWLEEVMPLCNTDWETFLRDKKLIGYNELLAYLATPSSERDLQSTIRIIQQRCRHYAKRQETFWRGFQKSLHTAYSGLENPDYALEIDTVNLTLLDVNLYIKQLLNTLNHC